jgi:hypothetical protein
MKAPKYRVSFYNRYDKLRHRVVTAWSEREATRKFQAMYENKHGFCPVVAHVERWGS